MEIELIIKIGGSCVSNKTLLYKALKTKDPEDITAALKINQEAINQIAGEISIAYSSMKKMIILTGVGSPGHFTVLKHDLHKGNNRTFEQHLGLLEAQIAVNRLRQTILEAFMKYQIPAVQFYASSMFESDRMRIITANTNNMGKFMGLGMVPVISGDIVPDISLGYSVLSGDQILADLANKFKPKKIVYGSDVDGIYNTDPKLDPNSQLIPEISRNEIETRIEEISGGDASGQMKGKLTEIKNLLEGGFKDIYLLNLTKKGTLAVALTKGNVPFTRFY
ncbi:MAG: isopentenyl phosphate kinase [Candidatus Hodarchaeales archaeon]|jgi:isopentenyl phosphate kinase